MPDETQLVGYAGDVAALIAARDVDQAKLKLRTVMDTVSDWMRVHGLSLALNKTEIVVLTKKQIPTIFPVQVGDATSSSRPSLLPSTWVS